MSVKFTLAFVAAFWEDKTFMRAWVMILIFIGLLERDGVDAAAWVKLIHLIKKSISG